MKPVDSTVSIPYALMMLGWSLTTNSTGLLPSSPTWPTTERSPTWLQYNCWPNAGFAPAMKKDTITAQIAAIQYLFARLISVSGFVAAYQSWGQKANNR